MKDAAEIEKNINRRVREKTDKQQKEYILREKLKATQDELNQMMGNDEENEEQEILRKLEEQEYPEEVSKKIKKELGLNEITVVATGGLGEIIAKEVKLINTVDRTLTLDGLRIIYELNK